ncbi:MAG TPA: hypothetical protein VJ045_00545 [Hyphomicrobiaceae bacterium]|nr:hypothetical protein [Hyphomicrobiaceae bacterium]
MTDKSSPAGWVVQISTQTREDAPKFAFFNVAIGAADKAIEAARKRAGAADDARIAVVRQLSSAEIAAINLRTGEVKPA